MTRQLIRYHYPHPDELMLDVCTRLADVYRNALASTAGQMDGPGRVNALLDFYFDLIEGRPKPKDDQVFDALMSLSTSSPTIRGALVGQFKLLGQVLSHEFSVQHPDLPHRAADELSFVFVSLMYGHWRMVASLGFSASHNRITRRAMERLIRSYLEPTQIEVEKDAVWD